ncbi:MAG TPA: outer membrane protein assembly factor BamA [Phycisphaerales bacterium]|nr:outer membrane protein assembly factor BamA [Phycisphaerales bacterium]
MARLLRFLGVNGSAMPRAIVARVLVAAGSVVSVGGQAIGQAGGAAGVPPVAPAPSQPASLDQPDTNPYEGRVVTEIRFEGLQRVTETFARNQVRTTAGRPLEWRVVREDLRRLERLGQFKDIQAEVQVNPPPDLSVAVVFKVMEAPIVRSVDVVGNRQISDEDIQNKVGTVVSLIAGVPRDEYQIGAAQRAVEDLYRSRGFYQAQVTVDESELEESGNVILRIREGEQTKVTLIRFEGNHAFEEGQLRPNLLTKEAWLFDKGVVNDEVLAGDASELVKFYRDRGYLDARASHRIQPSPNGREAIITFFIEEGSLYTLRNVEVESAGEIGADPNAPRVLTVFTPEQIRGLMLLKPGDVYGIKPVEDSADAVRDAYLKMGYVDAIVAREERRDPDKPLVDLKLIIREGQRFRAGVIVVQGNDLTQQKVVRRRIAVKPDRWLDGLAVKETEQRLKSSGLFNANPAFGRLPTATIQPEDPENPGVRDVLVQVEETNTGSLNFGAAVNSDAGVSGIFNLTQRNFDIADMPDSFDELLRGRAFRGAGQIFSLQAAPGSEQSIYNLSITEPSLFESEYGLTSSVYFRKREYDLYDEERYGTRWRAARRFGELWSAGLSLRAESIDLFNVNPGAPVDVFEVADRHELTSVALDATRSTVDNRFRPTQGTRLEFSAEQVGAIGGDFNYTRLSGEYLVFVTVDEDFLGNRTVLTWKSSVGLIPQDDESPVYERFYLGGRSFRGFDFRGIGPVGIRNDTGLPGTDHVGGDFMFFTGIELERPLWRDFLAGVIFIDSGTINDSLSLDDYRVAAGFGIRMYIPAFGQAPLAFDLGFPISKQKSDDERVFSFSIDIPF